MEIADYVQKQDDEDILKRNLKHKPELDRQIRGCHKTYEIF